MIAVEQFLESVKNRVIANYDKLGLRASGRYARELRIEKYAGGMRLTAPTYGYFMENGRAAGKAPPRDVIIKWIEDKQLQYQGISKESLAYLICRKIKREGIKVPNRYNSGGVITDVVNESLVEEAKEAFGSAIKSIIINNLKK